MLEIVFHFQFTYMLDCRREKTAVILVVYLLEHRFVLPARVRGIFLFIKQVDDGLARHVQQLALRWLCAPEEQRQE